MRYLNIDFEKAVDYDKLVKLFLNEFNEFKVAILINSEFFSNLKDDDEKAIIFWDISDIDIYKDIKIRSSIEFSENVDLSRAEFLLWLHKISISFNSKIYVQIDISDNPIGYFVAWKIDGKFKSLVLDAEEFSEDSEFSYCEPRVDMTKMLDF